jgi:hypothetical protein
MSMGLSSSLTTEVVVCLLLAAEIILTESASLLELMDMLGEMVGENSWPSQRLPTGK